MEINIQLTRHYHTTNVIKTAVHVKLMVKTFNLSEKYTDENAYTT